MPNFQQTVNLKEQLERKKRPQPKPRPEQRPIKTVPRPKAEQIDQVYNNTAETSPKEDLRTISQPLPQNKIYLYIRWIIIATALIIAAVSVYYIFFYNNSGEVAGVVEAEPKWYAVKLINGEIYYGEISDTTVDPVVIKNVYYNYDQANEGEASEAGNLRLVKRGKETHGPDGTMNIVRAQIVYMEPMKEDSKVLRAILDYEN